MRAYIVGVFLAAALCSSSTFAGVPVTAAQAAAEIEARGPAAFLAGLTPDQIDQLYEHFDGGDAAWLAIVPKLAAVADGANAEGLTISLAFALPKNAKAVLAITTVPDGVLAAQRVCSMPFIEDTMANRPAYRRKALVAVKKVKEQSLAAVKEACLATLKRSN